MSVHNDIQLRLQLTHISRLPLHVYTRHVFPLHEAT
mgnify:CR=1 FL=1